MSTTNVAGKEDGKCYAQTPHQTNLEDAAVLTKKNVILI